jgi:hypothetical protein
MLLASAGFLVLIVICLGIVLVATRGSGSDHAPGGATGTTSPGSGPRPDDGDQTIPTAAPPGVSWTFFHGVALPQSKTFGPARVDGDVTAGYAHSPTGALLAAVNISTRCGFSVDWRDVLREQTVPGPGQEAWVAIRTQSPINPDDPTPSNSYGQVAGFHFVNYSPEIATIELITQFANLGGAKQMSTLTVRWNGQDWLLELQPNGAPSPTATAVTEYDQFIPWGPS